MLLRISSICAEGGERTEKGGCSPPSLSALQSVSQSVVWCGVVLCFVLLVVVRAVRVVNAKGTDTDDVCAGC